jgi:hypothetical protein
VINDDNGAWLQPAFTQMYRLLKPGSFCVSFYGWSKADRFIAAWRSRARAITRDIGRIRQNEVDGGGCHAAHDLDAVALQDRIEGAAAACEC